MPYTSYAELSQRPEVVDLIRGEIAHLNAAVPHNLIIERFVNLHKEFDPDDGEVTRTRKLRRNVIDEHYKPIIDAIYDGRANMSFEATITYENGQTGSINRDLVITDLPAAEG